MKNADALQEPVSQQIRNDMVIPMNSLQNGYVFPFKHFGRGRKTRIILR